MEQAVTKQELSQEQTNGLINILKDRFRKNMNRHKGFDWEKVETRLRTDKKKIWSLNEMERTGGEPDVIGHDEETGEYFFYDCSAESPAGRRNTCFDHEGQDLREKQGIHPAGNAVEMAADIGIELLAEEQYRELQKTGNYDTKTSSWVKTPSDIRKLGGALFADRRYNNVFIYHNGAPSFYAARGFRGMIKV
jgi:hypothetical protein